MTSILHVILTLLQRDKGQFGNEHLDAMVTSTSGTRPIVECPDRAASIRMNLYLKRASRLMAHRLKKRKIRWRAAKIGVLLSRVRDHRDVLFDFVSASAWPMRRCFILLTRARNASTSHCSAFDKWRNIIKHILHHRFIVECRFSFQQIEVVASRILPADIGWWRWYWNFDGFRSLFIDDMSWHGTILLACPLIDKTNRRRPTDVSSFATCGVTSEARH